MSVRALRKHLHEALAKIECPQSRVYGWTGLVMDPTMYAMIENIPFTIPADPGPTTTYNGGFQTQQQMRSSEQLWETNTRNYFLSFENINRACFRCIDELVRPEYKVSNLPGLNGWNSTMSIQDILSQLETTFGRPSATVLFQNNTTFTSPFNPMETPETLFRRIEECQEIAVLGKAPYTVMQIVGTTMYLFQQSGIFPTREFETWETVASKTWPALKLHVQGAYQRKLISNSMRNTSGAMGYAPNQNAYNAFVGDDDSSVDTANTTVTVTAATTGSTLGSTYQASTVPAELAAAIQTIAANQQALFQHVAPLTQQMAALSHNPGSMVRAPPTGTTYSAPPAGNNYGVPQLPTYVGYNNGGAYGNTQGGHAGRGGSRGAGRGRTYGRGRGTRRQGRGRTAFADYIPLGRGQMGSPTPISHRPFQSNLVKKHNNWNVCYSCGFDVEDGHTSATCHMDWRKADHDVTFTRDNAQHKLTQGCNACTIGMHKTLLPGSN